MLDLEQQRQVEHFAHFGAEGLEADDAVAKLRDEIGATDPAEAAEGTVRKLFAESKGRNAIHASDSEENAANEIAFFFSGHERLGLG